MTMRRIPHQGKEEESELLSGTGGLGAGGMGAGGIEHELLVT